MSKTFLSRCVLLGVALSCVLALSVAQAGVPYPTKETPSAIDLGPLSAQAAGTPISVTVALRLPNLDAAEALLRAVSTPGDPQYRHFLSANEFVARFAPSKSDVAKVIAGFEKQGLTVEQTTATTLKVTGTSAAIERAFAVTLHTYEVPAHGDAPSYRYHAPLGRATIPAEVAGAVAAVVGLDTRPRLHPLHSHAASKQAIRSSSTTTNPPGLLTVTDFAQLYDIGPLYAKGLWGQNRTIGILTLAAFTPSDAFAYWSALGLTVNPNRMTVVNVDGGPGAPSDASGSVETTLDVEQSGGVAPGANIIVYQAPNNSQAFVDMFAAAIDANAADSLSISWGEWELFDDFGNNPVVDPMNQHIVDTTQAVHELLLRAAIQGQTVFSAAGDGGAYEVNRDLGCIGPFSPSDPLSCSLTLSVEYPSSDPAITAAGGTTLPGIQEYCLNAACTPPYYAVDIPLERAWGWDYLVGLCKALGFTPAGCGIEYAGGGGGVSFAFTVPDYQSKLQGVRLSQPGQVFQAGSGIFGAPVSIALPAHFPGRNLPDVSANADPQTGYIILYTSSNSGFGEFTFFGGTSFVAPQLNGVSALLGQYVNGRLGLLNYALYLAAGGAGPSAPLRTIKDGDDWFYHAGNGYTPAAGLGTLDVANFAHFLTH
jgi:subtilase family serine protease